MKRVSLFLACAVLVLCLPGWSRAEFYRWTDRDGREFYTNDKEKIPAEYRGSARTVEVHDDRVNVEQRSPSGKTIASAASEHKDKYGRGEQYWKQRAENLRRQMREQEGELALLAKQERDDEKRFGASSGTGKSKAASAREKKRTKIEKKLARLRHELEVELPEEARKADAYPGWVRE